MLAGEPGKQKFKGFPAERGRSGHGRGCGCPHVIPSPAEVWIRVISAGGRTPPSSPPPCRPRTAQGEDGGTGPCGMFHVAKASVLGERGLERGLERVAGRGVGTKRTP